MKKIIIPALLLLLLVGGCSPANEPETPQGNEVPTNNKGGTSSSDEDEERKKENMSDTDLANEEMGAADETGVVTSINGNDYVIDRMVNETIIDENGEEADISYGSGEEITFSITQETEIKVVLYDSQTYNSRLAAGNQADIKEGVSVSLFGSQAGGKFIASKVLVLQIN